MKILQFTQADIEELAQELSMLEDLTNRQRELLVAIFAAAADRAKPVAPVIKQGEPSAPAAVLPAPVIANQKPDGTITDFKKALLNSYIAGNDFSDLLATSNSGKVTEIHPS